MSSVCNSLFLIFGGLVYISCSSVQITKSPQTISNATIGSTVSFDCQLNDSLVVPGWNINGKDYRVTMLPSGYEYDGDSQVLIVSPVEETMNNSVYYCYFRSDGAKVNSLHAMLIILPLHNDGFSRWRNASWQVESTILHSISLSITSTSSTIILPKTPQHSAVNIGVIIITVAAVIVLLTTFIIVTLAIVVYSHRKERGESKCNKNLNQEYQVYEEISTIPTIQTYEKHLRLQTNPAYESVNKPSPPNQTVYEEISTIPTIQTNERLQTNPAYESVNKPSPPNQTDHVYDVVKEL